MKFSIPYTNLVKSSLYLKFINYYSQHIENIYLGIPELENHLCVTFDNETQESYNFLKDSIGLYKRIVAFNGIGYNKSDYDLFKYFDETIYPLIEKYSIDGFILSSLPLAQKLHKDFPKLELHTSCNTFIWDIRQMYYWKEYAGIEIFNPPREICRKPNKLKEMYKEGFKLKVLVNENCMYNCPYTINHAYHMINGTNRCYTCPNKNDDYVFKTNLFLPEWLDTIQEYVYCFKLAGRNSNLNFLKKCFDSYILKKDYDFIDEICTYETNNIIQLLKNKGIRISGKQVPLKVSYCECKECETCKECENAINRVMYENKVS